MTRLTRLVYTLAILAPPIATAQTGTSHTIRGSTTTLAGTPVSGAEVFLLESLDAVTTDSAGNFVLRTTAQGAVTLVARHIGYAPASLSVPADTGCSV